MTEQNNKVAWRREQHGKMKAEELKGAGLNPMREGKVIFENQRARVKGSTRVEKDK